MTNSIKSTLIFFSFALSACSIETEEKNGPNGSWWLGGDDGGVFVRIWDDENKNDKLYQGEIYFENTQKIWYQGKFQLVGDLNFTIEDRAQYQFWDGEKLYLIESSYLEPTSAIPTL